MREKRSPEAEAWVDYKGIWADGDTDQIQITYKEKARDVVSRVRLLCKLITWMVPMKVR